MMMSVERAVRLAFPRLTDIQQRVIVTLIEHGECSVNFIAINADVYVTQAYGAIETLMGLGLVSKHLRDRWANVEVPLAYAGWFHVKRAKFRAKHNLPKVREIITVTVNCEALDARVYEMNLTAQRLDLAVARRVTSNGEINTIGMG